MRALGDSQALQRGEGGLLLALRLPLASHGRPDQPAEVGWSGRGRQVCSLGTWPLAWGPATRQPQGGQAGIGKGDQGQGGHGGPSGAVLVRAPPQPLLTVLTACHGPAAFLRLAQPSRRQRGARGPQPQALPGGAVA